MCVRGMKGYEPEEWGCTQLVLEGVQICSYVHKEFGLAGSEYQYIYVNMYSGGSSIYDVWG